MVPIAMWSTILNLCVSMVGEKVDRWTAGKKIRAVRFKRVHNTV